MTSGRAQRRSRRSGLDQMEHLVSIHRHHRERAVPSVQTAGRTRPRAFARGNRRVREALVRTISSVSDSNVCSFLTRSSTRETPANRDTPTRAGRKIPSPYSYRSSQGVFGVRKCIAGWPSVTTVALEDSPSLDPSGCDVIPSALDTNPQRPVHVANRILDPHRSLSRCAV